MKLRYFTEQAYNSLFDHLESNQQYYSSESCWLKEFFGQEEYSLESKIEYPDFDLLYSGEKKEDKIADDFNNAVTVHKALGSVLTPKQACNKYMWSLLAHERYWGYTKHRWLMGNNISIETRCFCGDTRRGLARNSISRLWWYGYLSYDSDAKKPYERMQLLIQYPDLCQNLVEREYAMNKTVMLGVLDGIQAFFDSGGSYSVRVEKELCKYINRVGAVSSLDMLERQEISEMTFEYLKNQSNNNRA